MRLRDYFEKSEIEDMMGMVYVAVVVVVVSGVAILMLEAGRGS